MTMRWTARVPLALTLVALAACGDARLGKLAVGMSKDSLAKVMADPPHRTASYLTAGRVWQLNLYAQKPVGDGDSVAWRAMSPVVLINDKVIGWGWGWWSKEAAKVGIAVPAK